jgi:hypothetical protein
LDLTGRIVTNTADLIDSEEKRRILLDAWSQYARTATSNVDAFPSLVPTAPHAASSSSRWYATSQARTVVPKSAKQTNNALWARVEEAASNKNLGAVPGLTRNAPVSKEKYPALPSAAKAAAKAVSTTAGERGATAWASHRAPALSPGSTYFPAASSASSSYISKSTVSSRPQTRPTSSAAEFPGLPAIPAAHARAQQKAALFNRSGTSTPNSWGGGASSPELTEAIERSLADLAVNGDGQAQAANTAAPSAGGKKKKGKQLLFQYGL